MKRFIEASFRHIDAVTRGIHLIIHLNKINKNKVLRLFLVIGDPFYYVKTLMLSALRIELRNNRDG
jgi:hypothetical protein